MTISLPYGNRSDQEAEAPRMWKFRKIMSVSALLGLLGLLSVSLNGSEVEIRPPRALSALEEEAVAVEYEYRIMEDPEQIRAALTIDVGDFLDSSQQVDSAVDEDEDEEEAKAAQKEANQLKRKKKAERKAERAARAAAKLEEDRALFIDVGAFTSNSQQVEDEPAATPEKETRASAPTEPTDEEKKARKEQNQAKKELRKKRQQRQAERAANKSP